MLLKRCNFSNFGGNFFHEPYGHLISIHPLSNSSHTPDIPETHDLLFFNHFFLCVWAHAWVRTHSYIHWIHLILRLGLSGSLSLEKTDSFSLSSYWLPVALVIFSPSMLSYRKGLSLCKSCLENQIVKFLWVPGSLWSVSREWCRWKPLEESFRKNEQMSHYCCGSIFREAVLLRSQGTRKWVYTHTH